MESVKSYGLQAWNQSLAFLNSDGLIPQLALTVIIVLVIHFIITTVESFVKGVKNYNHLSATILPYTYMSKGDGDGKQTVVQDSASSNPYMYPSENEVNGLEFSYSFHLYVDPDNYGEKRSESANDYRTIFYKGSSVGPWPIMGPGVFLNARENSIRIYMNAINSVKDNYVEVPNIPVGKWMHMVITQKGQNMDIFINGNIAVRKTFVTMPRINFGNFYAFPSDTLEGSTATDNFSIKGAMSGMISRVKYYAYALSFNQIDSLYTEGASKKIISASYDQTPPYFHDSWWVTRYNNANAHYGL